MPRLRIAYALTAIGAPVLTAATLSTAPRSDRIAVAGVLSMKVGQQQALPVGDQAGPVPLLTQSAGTNRYRRAP